MAERPKLTRKAQRALAWVAANEPVKMFPCGAGSACTITMAKRLEKDGWLTMARPANGFGFSRYLVSEAGRQYLASLEKGGER